MPTGSTLGYWTLRTKDLCCRSDEGGTCASAGVVMVALPVRPRRTSIDGQIVGREQARVGVGGARDLPQLLTLSSIGPGPRG